MLTLAIAGQAAHGGSIMLVGRPVVSATSSVQSVPDYPGHEGDAYFDPGSG